MKRLQTETFEDRPNSGESGYTREHRPGLVLIIVTVTLAMLSLAAWSYSSRMLTELEATSMSARGNAARMAAESGIEFAATRVLERDLEDDVNLFHDPSVLKGRLITDSTGPRGRLRFSLVVPDETNIATGATRFGLASENSKFNINRLIEIDAFDIEEEGIIYEAMSVIPGITPEIVDSLMDALDSDSDRRPGGAEISDYEAMGIYDAISDGPFDSIDQLLQVQGVTPELFYGEDANRNGLLDPNENDGDKLPPLDNADGLLDLGWRDYLTASSRERNTTPDGEPKINLNQGMMTELFDAVEAEFGVEAASFVVGYRLNGTDYAQQAFSQPEVDVTGVSRNGIDLTVVPTFQFTSVFELLGGTTNTVKMAEGADQEFVSPWGDDASTLLNVVPQLEEMFTTTDNAWIEGRININEARVEVMRAVPFMPSNVPDAILSARPPVSVEGASASVMARRKTAAWLLAEKLVDIEILRKIGPWITTGGDVFSVQSVGHYDQGGPTIRLEARIDATEFPPRVTFVRDLTHLGPGYHPSLLTPE